MKTVRRLYFYAVAFISLEVVLWGLIGLLRSIVGETVGAGAEALAQALALILVGVPIFLVHWLWAQRSAEREDEEKTAALRAIFLYGVLLGTLVPLVQNLLAILNRALILAMHLDTYRALLGGSQTLADNAIAILMNGVVAIYFWTILRGEWPGLPDPENFADVRRLYRYLWVLYSLLMVVFGAQQLLRFLFYVPTDMLGELSRETVANGIVLLLVGTPLWVYTWRIAQDALGDPGEARSNLRLAVLYLLALGGVIAVLSAGGTALDVLLRRLLGEVLPLNDFVRQIGAPVSIGVPLGMVWAYFGYWLERHIESAADPVRQAGMRRVYHYILSALGLGAAFIGLAMLLSFTIDALTRPEVVWGGAFRPTLAAALATLSVGLPVWLAAWRPIQVRALDPSGLGDHARQSIIRKAYLYLALFVGVIGGMSTAVGLVFNLIKAVLTGGVEGNFLANVLNLAQLLCLFAVLFVYHLSVLRTDATFTAGELAAKQGSYRVLVLDSGNGFGASIKSALARYAPGVPVTLQTGAGKPKGRFQALVLPGSLAIGASEWIAAFNGSRVVVPDEGADLIWAGGISKQAVSQAAQTIRQLAEGQQIRQQTPASSAWMVVVYVAAALFGLELLMLVVGIGISLIAG
jgi:hypothetical protein